MLRLTGHAKSNGKIKVCASKRNELELIIELETLPNVQSSMSSTLVLFNSFRQRWKKVWHCPEHGWPGLGGLPWQQRPSCSSPRAFVSPSIWSSKRPDVLTSVTPPRMTMANTTSSKEMQSMLQMT